MPTENLERKYQIHKDSLPEETIKKVRDILSGLGLFLLEKHWSVGVVGVYSARIKDAVIKVGSNGKGVSKRYALAGAYAEYMERLQAGVLVNESMGLMPSPLVFSPDKVSVAAGRLTQRCKPVMENILHESVENICDIVGKNTKIDCFPYYNVFDKSVEHLPILVNWATSSNGLCAGNTPEEAICQGICEIFERFAGKKIYDDEVSFPTVPVHAFKESAHYEMLQKIIDQKYHVIIKDCTLGGVFPVLALIIVNEKYDRYTYAFGSDPMAEVALQRCITEAFQGVGAGDLKKDIDTRWLKLDFSARQFENKHFPSIEDQKLQECDAMFRYHTGELPNRIFLPDGESKFRDAFQSEFKSHYDSLEFLLRIIKTFGFKLYIRDHSFLGFPAYRIYIPGISEIQKLRKELIAVLLTERQFILKCLLNLKDCSRKNIYKCASLLEPLLDIPGPCYELTRNNSFIRLINIHADASSGAHVFNHLAYLLTFMFYRSKDYKKALKHLNLYMKEVGGTLKNRGYYNGVALFLKLKSEGASDKVIKEALGVLFDDEQSKVFIDGLSNSEDVFKHFILPKCGDCSRCPIANQCYYEQWKNVALEIKERMAQHPIKQDRLSALFS